MLILFNYLKPCHCNLTVIRYMPPLTPSNHFLFFFNQITLISFFHPYSPFSSSTCHYVVFLFAKHRTQLGFNTEHNYLIIMWAAIAVTFSGSSFSGAFSPQRALAGTDLSCNESMFDSWRLDVGGLDFHSLLVIITPTQHARGKKAHWCGVMVFPSLHEELVVDEL